MAAYSTASLNGFTARMAVIFWAQMICIYNISHIPALMMLDRPGFSGTNLLLYLLVITQLSDVFQFVFGKLFGRTKIAPTVSPNKTVEGLVGGIVSVSILSPFLSFLTGFSIPISIASALLIGVLGFFGGLMLSAVKRDRGVKDWGDFIPGHGGMLDRFDSLVFSAPVFFHFVRYFVVEK